MVLPCDMQTVSLLWPSLRGLAGNDELSIASKLGNMDNANLVTSIVLNFSYKGVWNN